MGWFDWLHGKAEPAQKADAPSVFLAEFFAASMAQKALREGLAEDDVVKIAVKSVLIYCGLCTEEDSDSDVVAKLRGLDVPTRQGVLKATQEALSKESILAELPPSHMMQLMRALVSFMESVEPRGR